MPAKKTKAKSPDARSSILRALPSIDECLRAAEARPTLAGLSRAYLKTVITRAQISIRHVMLEEKFLAPNRDDLVQRILSQAEHAAAADEPALKTVVNATGVVLHTNLGRAILPESAIEAIERAARSAVNLEFDLEGGGRGDRDDLVESELCAMTGAEAATVVNNNAAAVLLALTAIADGREVIVSRGELIEIGGSFRLPDVMARSGALLREVGTTNRTHPHDYESAIGPDTALLLKVHPSNYRVVGFTSEVSLEELVNLGRERGIPVMEDLGAGALVDMSAYGLPREPVVAERISAGVGLVSFSGDKLLGGPQAGIVVGTRELIGKLKANALKRALRCDKLTLAALSATLRLYLRSANLAAELPTLRYLTRSLAEMKQIAPRARDLLLERLGPEFQIEIVDATSQIGSGALPTEELPTIAIRVTHPKTSANAIAANFRRARPPIIGRVTDDGFQLDLRTIEDPAIFAASFPNRS
ncbi:MAG TPA: L-seryl-tRNA(Sec) selenium transferase [Candidatus Binataceae bacterium]|nr:L-seryl-tRNA(Sec) selenium transferase [Candidatus Binataceae bacterium]